MSGSGAPGGPDYRGPNQAAPGTGVAGAGASGTGTSGANLASDSDPSMEDILASIRRILSEDEQTSPRHAEPMPRDPPPASAEPQRPEVFNLEASMIVDEEPQPPEVFMPEPSRPDIPLAPTVTPQPATPAPVAQTPPGSSVGMPSPGTGAGGGSLVAPAAAAAAAMSLGSLRRTLEAERPVPARGAVTVEEMVREELRPVLKAWLDEHLAPIVERLVRAEIERVVAHEDP